MVNCRVKTKGKDAINSRKREFFPIDANIVHSCSRFLIGYLQQPIQFYWLKSWQFDRWSWFSRKVKFLRIRGPFLESPATFRAHFGWHNSLCIGKTKTFRGTKFCSYFNFYYLYNIWKDQLYWISRPEFYERLFGSENVRDFQETVPSTITEKKSKTPKKISQTLKFICSSFGMKKREIERWARGR